MYYAVDKLFPVISAFTDRSFVFRERCSQTRLSVLHTEMMERVHSDPKSSRCVKSELVWLQPETQKLKRADHKTSTLHYSSAFSR